MTLTSDDVRIEDPDFYFEDRREIYPRLHRDHPVFHYEPLDVFVLSRHEDIREAARHPEIFSSGRGLHLHQLRLTQQEKAVYATLYGTGEQFGYADPPRHRELRGVASRSFAPKALSYLVEHVRRHVATIVDELPSGEPFDFVEAVAAPLPIRTAETLIGLPSGYEAEIRGWSDALESMKLVRGVEELTRTVAQFSSMNDFFREQIAHKRAHPGEDLITTLLDARLDGRPLAEPDLLNYCNTFLAAGSDTTRSLLAGMALALAEHPDQLARLRTDRSLLDKAVEESLRWTTPARGFLRTAVAETELHGTSIRPGQRVYLLFDAGNRDPEAFADPWTYDVERPGVTSHLAFGYGVHLCIAAHLARMEARVLFTALLDRFSTFELAGKPREIRQVLRNGWHELPVTLR